MQRSTMIEPTYRELHNNPRGGMRGSKGKLILFDLDSRRVIAEMDFTKDQNESVNDVKLLPSYFSFPPLSFVRVFETRVGFSADKIIKDGIVPSQPQMSQ